MKIGVVITKAILLWVSRRVGIVCSLLVVLLGCFLLKHIWKVEHDDNQIRIQGDISEDKSRFFFPFSLCCFKIENLSLWTPRKITCDISYKICQQLILAPRWCDVCRLLLSCLLLINFNQRDRLHEDGNYWVSS